MITYSMPVTRATVGTSVTLKCKSRNHMYISWSKNGTDSVLHFKSSTDKRGSQLHINNVTRADNGTYKCLFVPPKGPFVYRYVELVVLG